MTVVTLAAVVGLRLARKRVSASTPPTTRHELDVSRAGLTFGVANGASLLSGGAFLGLLISRMAHDLSVGDNAIQQASALSSLVGLGVMVLHALVWRGVPSARLTTGAFGLAAAGLAAVAAATSISLVNAGMMVTSLPTLALAPTRPALARQFRERKLDGTFGSLVRKWSYITITIGSLTSGALALMPGGWRLASAGLAGFLAFVAWMLNRSHLLPRRSVADERLGLYDLWNTIRLPEMRRQHLAVLFCVGVIQQLLWLGLEPFLHDVGLRRGASLFVATVGSVRLLSLRWIRRYGDLSNTHLLRAATLASRWLFASGLAVALTLAPFVIPVHVLAVLAVIVGVVLLVEIGVGPLNDSARTYASRLAIEAEVMAGLVYAAANYVGGQIASVVTWQAAVPVWVGLAALTLVVTHVKRFRDTGVRVEKPATRSDTARLYVDERGGVTVAFGHARRRRVRVKTPAREGNRIVVEGPAAPTSSVRARVVLFTVEFQWRSGPAPKQDGLLGVGATFPVVWRQADGTEVFAVGRWRGPTGRAVVRDGGWTELHSRALRADLTVRVEEPA